MVGTDKPLIADLESIWDFYVDAAGQRTAENVVRGIVETCRIVEAHPFAGRTRDKVRPGLRSLVSHRNVIFYRVRDDGPEIVRVLDGRRDIDAIFDN
jgi:toxin ParE1/3/4